MAPSTRDPAEIAKFSALAAEWWNPKGPFAALHRMNPVRLQFIRDVARRSLSSPACGGGGERSEPEGVSAARARPLSPATHAGNPVGPLSQMSGAHEWLGSSPARGGAKALAGLAVLDLGCGGGLISAPLARMGANVTAIDASEEAIGAARAHADAAGLAIKFRCATAEALVTEGASFDFVVAFEIVEHVADVRAFLAAAAALVKPGGVLALSTINRTPKARALAIVGAERILQWAPEGAHDYDKLVTPEEIRAGAPELGWETPVGITYNPLGAGWALSNDTDVNYLIAGRKPESMRSPA